MELNDKELTLVIKLIEKELSKNKTGHVKSYSKLKSLHLKLTGGKIVKTELDYAPCNYINGFSSNINDRLNQIRQLETFWFNEIALQQNPPMISYMNDDKTIRLNIYITKMTVVIQFNGTTKRVTEKKVGVEDLQRIFAQN
jgi:hypothetical protein